MKREKLTAALALLLSASLMAGGWAAVGGLLGYQRTRILQSGGIVCGLYSESGFWAGDGGTQEEYSAGPLTAEETARLLEAWEGGGTLLLHEPRDGQMSMEQAIRAGEAWIASLAERGVLSEYLPEDGFDQVSARLCTVTQTAEEDERLLGCWFLTYRAKDAELALKLHAISGAVWRADFSLRECEDTDTGLAEGELAAELFPAVGEADAALQVKIARSYVRVNDESPCARLSVWLEAKNAEIKVKNLQL